MFLKGKDYLSIWSIAHQWVGIDPESTQEDDLPEQIQYLIHKMVEGYWNRDLKLRRPSGYGIPREPLLILLWNFNWWHKALERCLMENEFDKSKLDNFYVQRAELIALCKKEELDLPEFWQRKTLVSKGNHRPMKEAIDKAVCQAVARTYWAIDPRIHPAHMAKATAITNYANGDEYKDENTVKNWIAEFDPLKNQRVGRPQDIVYLVDLKTGALSQKLKN